MKAVNLIQARDGQSVEGILMPTEFYWIMTSPGKLAGMQYPREDFPWLALNAAGVSRVVSLEPGTFDPSPLMVLYAHRLEDLFHGGPPREPAREINLIRQAVTLTSSAVRAGAGVVVHCAGGRGRTGTVIGCVLRELGCDAEAVVAYLHGLHKARGKAGWPESAWQSALVRGWKPDA